MEEQTRPEGKLAVTFEYDVNGNRLSQMLTIAGVTETTTYTNDALDQLRSFSVLPGAGSEAEPRHTWYVVLPRFRRHLR
ncbi:MAG: hypothetical protein EA398_08910 [Deltaproteobacteria bacterium]|nr:MAG: hypothetical protein EA398_08910 [Deltaproteobacteria bacterium]